MGGNWQRTFPYRKDAVHEARKLNVDTFELLPWTFDPPPRLVFFGRVS
jgi:hypothetical protein